MLIRTIRSIPTLQATQRRPPAFGSSRTQKVQKNPEKPENLKKPIMQIFVKVC
jgi:hypothetical protein